MLLLIPLQRNLVSDLQTALLVAFITGGVSTFGTVIALRIHILYIRNDIKRIDESVTRAHIRIDNVDGKG